MVNITFPDESTEKHKDGITPAEIAKTLGERLFKDALAARINEKIVDLNYPIKEDCKIEILTFDHKKGKEVYWHSSSHIMAAAVKKVYPNVHFGIGPSIEEGFYYDFDNLKITDEDLEKIEDEIKKIIEKDIPFEKKEISKQEAKKLFAKEKFKLELIGELEDEKISIYKLGDFVDMCRGPHVPSSGKIGAIKLIKLSGAYWRGDSNNPMLQRIYGISFRTQKELNAFLDLKRKAEERDHRKIGQQLDLYSFQEEAPGMPLFHPKGVILWNELMKFWREEHKKAGYVEVKTPIILRKDLWIRSGHWDHYKENMYFTKIDDADFAIKPMNCPGGMLIYKARFHSYRELPLRMAEVGLVHRQELSGVLSGLFRVRSITQDDAHIFMTNEQIKDEIIGVIKLSDKIYKTFGLEYHMELSTRPEKSIGTDEQWETAEAALKEALEELKIDYKLNPGDGAFYGPKIDFHLKDVLGRTWQCGTIQLDMAMPEKFDLSYVGEDNKPHRIVMIHRTIYGALERFIGILVEHYGGAFPFWLSPIQVRIVPVTDRNFKFANHIKEELEKCDIRVEVDRSSTTVEYKIRNAQLEKIPYALTVGDKEEKNKSIAVRTRDGKVKFGVNVKDFVKQILNDIKNKK
ncbi:MAG: threonine--tRNA ligase [Candidatus Aenigmarchaeota archaeon]|nr:threonine--tRNA ligase [Candidatus Aenigmarchaeota archaeon]